MGAGEGLNQQHTEHHPGTTRGFSLIELVIVVVIIGIIGAVAIPRMSRGSQGAAVSALTGNLNILNKAVDHYAAEHGGDFPRAASVATQLTNKTNHDGSLWAGGAGELGFGPYIRAIPPMPVGDKKGNTVIAVNNGGDVGWFYNPATGVIRPNLTKDDGSTDEVLVTNIINSTAKVRDDLVKP